MFPMPRQMPAEFEPHQNTLMCWPSRDDIWDGQIAESERAYAELANTIATYEPVIMIVDPKHIENRSWAVIVLVRSDEGRVHPGRG